MEEIILDRSDVIQEIVDALSSSNAEMLSKIYEMVIGSEIAYIGQDQFQMWIDYLDEDEENYAWDNSDDEDEDDEFDF